MDGWPYDEDDVSDEDDIYDEDDMSVDYDVYALASIRKNDRTLQNHELMIYDRKPVQQLAEALQGNTHLKRLSLSIDSLMFDAKTLASAIVNAKLTHLILARLHFREGEDRCITNCLLGAAKQSPTIQHLEVYTVDDKCLDEIASCMPHIESLHLRGNFIAGNVELLYKGLQRTSTLTSLHLYDPSIGSTDCFRQLSQALTNNSSLTSLRIENCGMDDDRVKAFLEHWHRDSQIHTLTFTSTKIKAKGAMLLIQAASSHPAMESLIIRENPLIGYDGLASIAMELPNIVLKSLSLAGCAWNCFGRYRPNWKEAAAVVGGLVVQGVSANNHLLEIDVTDNGLNATGQDVGKALTFYTLRNKYIPLMVSDLLVPASFWCHCFAKNGQSASIIFHFLREQPVLWHVCRKNKRQRTR